MGNGPSTTNTKEIGRSEAATQKSDQMGMAAVNQINNKGQGNTQAGMGISEGIGASLEGANNQEIIAKKQNDTRVATQMGMTQDAGIARQASIDADRSRQAAQEKTQENQQRQMALSADAQNAGMTASMNYQAKASEAANATKQPAQTTVQPSTAEKPDYNEIYQTEADVFTQNQARDWQNRMDFMSQRAAEKGMKGTDLSSYQAHLELGNRVGVLDARQNIMLEGLKRDTAFQEKDYFQTRSEDRADMKEKGTKYMELLNQNWGDEEAINSILQMAVGVMGEDSYFGDMLRNPDSLRNLNDTGYNKRFQERNTASSEVLRTIKNPMDMLEVNGTFSNWRDAQYGSSLDITVPGDLMEEDLDQGILAEYEEEFGEVNFNDPADVKNVYAYEQYRKDVKNSLHDEAGLQLVNDYLANGGDEKTAEKIRSLDTGLVFSLMDDDATARFMGESVDATDPINGPLSFMFSDWKGNLYGEGNEYESRPTVDKNLDKVYQSYWSQSIEDGSDPVSRKEFLKAALDEDEGDEGFDFTEENMSKQAVSDVGNSIKESLNVSQSELPTDSSGNVVTLDSSIASYDEDGGWTLSKDVSKMDNTEKDAALGAINVDDAAFYDILFSMEETDMERFIQDADRSKLDDMKNAGVLPFDISESELDKGNDYSVDEFERMGIKSGNVIMKNGDWYVISNIMRHEDSELFGKNDFRNEIFAKKINKETGELEGSVGIWSDEANDEYDERDSSSFYTDTDLSSGYYNVGSK